MSSWTKFIYTFISDLEEKWKPCYIQSLSESKFCQGEQASGQGAGQSSILEWKTRKLVYLQCSSKGSCPAQAPSLGKEIWQWVSPQSARGQQNLEQEIEIRQMQAKGQICNRGQWTAEITYWGLWWILYHSRLSKHIIFSSLLPPP